MTASLRKIIEQAEIAGISFAAMQAGLDEEFAEPGETTELPQFWHMKIADTLRAGLGWRDPAGRCDGCGWALWTDNDFTFIAPDKAHTDPKIPHRTVFRSNHDGQDFFNLDDRGPAVMTAKFRRLLEQAGIAELKFQPADFIDG